VLASSIIRFQLLCIVRLELTYNSERLWSKVKYRHHVSLECLVASILQKSVLVSTILMFHRTLMPYASTWACPRHVGAICCILYDALWLYFYTLYDYRILWRWIILISWSIGWFYAEYSCTRWKKIEKEQNKSNCG